MSTHHLARGDDAFRFAGGAAFLRFERVSGALSLEVVRDDLSTEVLTAP